MPSNVPISFSFAGLPSGYCFTTFNRFALDIIAQMAGYVPGQYTFFNYGNTTPDVDDRDKPWVRLAADGTYDPRSPYVFVGGNWVATHPLLPGDRKIAPASLTLAADVWAYDGGSGDDPATVTPTGSTGAMWEIDPAFAAKFPLGAGTLPSTLSVGVGDTGGEETHALVAAEIPKHQLFVANNDAITTGSGPDNPLTSTNYIARKAENGHDNPDYVLRATSTVANVGLSSPYGGDVSGNTTAHNTMPPWVGVYFIRRTNRTQYLAP